MLVWLDNSSHVHLLVLLAVNSQLICFRRTDLEVNAEMLACEVSRRSPTCRFLISVFYRPPEHDEQFPLLFKEFLDLYTSSRLSNLILIGDFNFPHIDWSSGTPLSPDLLTGKCCCTLQDYFVSQCNMNITRPNSNSHSSGSILDLVITDNEQLVDNVFVHL